MDSGLTTPAPDRWPKKGVIVIMGGGNEWRRNLGRNESRGGPGDGQFPPQGEARGAGWKPELLPIRGCDDRFGESNLSLEPGAPRALAPHPECHTVQKEAALNRDIDPYGAQSTQITHSNWNPLAQDPRIGRAAGGVE